MTAFGVSPAALAASTAAAMPLASILKVFCIDVDEDRRGADQHRHFRRRAEGEGRTDHGIARPNATAAQRQHQRVGAAGAGDDMLGAAEGGELGLERPHFRAHDELAMIEHARDGAIDRLAQPAALRADIDERK